MGFASLTTAGHVLVTPPHPLQCIRHARNFAQSVLNICNNFYMQFLQANATSAPPTAKTNTQQDVIVNDIKEESFQPASMLHLTKASLSMSAFTTDDCSVLTNCIMCMVDARCGWCPDMNSCMSRASSQAMCKSQGGLVTRAGQCSNCGDAVYCKQCLTVS